MIPKLTHPWNLTPEEAQKLQQQLASQVITQDQFTQVQRVAGVDVAYDETSDRLVAAVVVLESQTLDLVETVTVEDQVRFPYLPGLFSFREIPPLIKALVQLNYPPDLIICDGQGLAHPRRFGLACHLGVLYDIPTIGCGKTLLVGQAEKPGYTRGDWTPILEKGELLGAVLRTQNHINPLYISIGHRISLPTACYWILKLSPHYRLPETTRQADQCVRKALKTLIYNNL